MLFRKDYLWSAFEIPYLYICNNFLLIFAYICKVTYSPTLLENMTGSHCLLASSASPQSLLHPTL